MIALARLKRQGLSEYFRKFGKLNISTAFLDLDPENWPSSEYYLKGLEVVQNIKVTNDHAERGVALVQEFNRHITHDEDQ